MTLLDIKNVFLSVLPKATYHYYADGATGNYIVWAEDSQGDSLHSDNVMKALAVQGTIDYYTKTEYDTIAQEIEMAMNNSKISWKLNSIQFEEENGYIHSEWIWEVNKIIG